MQNNIDKKALHEYVQKNDVVYQIADELVNVANDDEIDNRNELLSFIDDASSVEVYQKGHCFIKDEFADLDGWSTNDDVLLLLQNIGVLICVPRQHAIENKLIAA